MSHQDHSPKRGLAELSRRKSLKQATVGLVGVGVTAVALLASTSLAFGAAGRSSIKGLTPYPTVKSLTSCKTKTTKIAKVGVLAPLTGASAPDAVPDYDAALLAASQLNAAGGVCAGRTRYKLSIVTADTHNMEVSEVESGVKLLETTPNLNFVMTSYADTSNFEETLFAKVNMPYLLSGGAAQTQAIISKDPSKYPTIWSRVPSYATYGTALPPLIDHLVAAHKLKLHYGKTVDIVKSQDAYGAGIGTELAHSFAKLGWKVNMLGTVVYGQTSDWSSYLTKIRANPPSVIVVTDWAAGDDAAFQNQFVQKPTKSLVFEQYAPALGQYLSIAGKHANGVIYDDLGAAIPSLASTKAINAAYVKRFHQAPSYFSVIGYNELTLYAYCIKKTGNPANRLAIGRCIGNLNIMTPAGPLKFDHKTHLASQAPGYMPIGFFQIQNGKQVQIAPSQYAQAKFQTPAWMK